MRLAGSTLPGVCRVGPNCVMPLPISGRGGRRRACASHPEHHSQTRDQRPGDVRLTGEALGGRLRSPGRSSVRRCTLSKTRRAGRNRRALMQEEMPLLSSGASDRLSRRGPGLAPKPDHGPETMSAPRTAIRCGAPLFGGCPGHMRFVPTRSTRPRLAGPSVAKGPDPGPGDAPETYPRGRRQTPATTTCHVSQLAVPAELYGIRLLLRLVSGAAQPNPG